MVQLFFQVVNTIYAFRRTYDQTNRLLDLILNLTIDQTQDLDGGQEL